ncbi:MAG: hypothetical protein KIT57_14675 [Blastocatellales bacterium]|nr:hypothetical protein [Blastocatellales bacterium]
MKLVMQIEKAEHVLARAVREANSISPHHLPGIRNGRLQREPGLIEIPQIELTAGQQQIGSQPCQFDLVPRETLLHRGSCACCGAFASNVVLAAENFLERVAADDLPFRRQCFSSFA